MAETTNKILLDITVKKDAEIQNRVAAIEDLTKKINELKDVNKQLAKQEGDHTEAILTNKAAIKGLNAEIANRNREVANLIKANQAELGSNNQLKAAISLLENQYAAMSKAEREAGGKELQANLKALRDELNANKKAAGDFTSNIGHYEEAVQEATLSLGEMKKQLKELKNTSFVGKTEAEIKAIQEQIGTLTNDMSDAMNKMKAADKGEILNNLAGSLQGVINGVQLLSASFQALGIDSEWAKKLEASTMQLISATQALQSIRDLKDKGVFAATKLQVVEIAQTARQTVVTWAQTNAEAARATMTGKANIATKAAAAAQLLFNKALAASPIGLIITGVVALGAATYLLVKALTKVSQAEKDRRINAEITKKTNEDVQQSTGEMVTKLRFYQSIANDTTKTEKERKAALSEIAKETNGVIKVTDLNTKSLENLNAQMTVYIDKAIAKAKVDSLLKQASETQIEIENRKAGVVQEEVGFWNQLFNSIISGGNAATTTLKNTSDATKANAEALQNATDREKAIRKQLEAAYNSTINLTNEETKAIQKNTAAKDDRLAKQKELFDQQKANEKEYRDFIQNITNEVNTIIVDAQAFRLAEVTANEEKMLNVIDRAKQAEVLTEAQAQEKRKKITEDAEKERLSIIAEYKLVELEKVTAEELANHNENEMKKLEITRDALMKEIEIRKAAGQSTAELEAQLRDTKAQMWQKELTTQLLDQTLSLREQHRLKQEFAQKELEDAQGNAEKELEIKKAMLDEEQAYREAVIQKAQEYANAIQNLMTEASNLQSQREANELAAYEARQERMKQANAERLQRGEINEREYQANIRTLEEQAAKKKAQLERQAAIRDKAAKIFSATIAVAAEVAANLANPIMATIIAAAGAAQIATIASTPLPKAARGRLISGRSHAEGGEIIEAENGEAIINAEATSRNLPLLDAINQSTGGVPLMTGGFAERSSIQAAQSKVTTEALTQAFTQAAKMIQPVVSVEQINRVNSDVNVIQSRAKF